MKQKLLIIILVVISLIFLNKRYNYFGTNSELASEQNTRTQREKHQQFLDNSPFKETLKLTKPQRKAVQLPPNKYYEREWELTMNPAIGHPEPNKVLALQERLLNKSLSYRMPGDNVSNSWVDRGPNNVGGRTRVVLFDPNDITNKKVFAGGVSGGLWVNVDITNAGSPWTLVTGVPSNMNISCITVDPRDSNTWYIGTGEQYTSGAAVGNGVYKTIDGGVNWVNVPVQVAGPSDLTYSTTLFLRGIYYINDIIAWDNGTSTEIFLGVGAHSYGDASNKRNLLGLQSAGLYKTTNDGLTWTRIESANMQFSWSGIDFYFIPNDFEIAADNTLWMGTISTPSIGGSGGGRVFNSTNGSTWTQVTTLSNSNRVELAVSSTNATKMYALTQGTTSSGPHIFATTDAFNTETELSKPNDVDTDIPSKDFTRGQAFYDLVIEVDPTNDDIVYVGGIDLFRTDQGENTDLSDEWKQISKWSNNNNLFSLTCSNVHADQHAFTFRPGNSNEAVIGGDGGVYYASSLSTAENNAVFTAMNKDYNVTQFYYGGYGQSISNELILAGAQDNGTPFINGASVGANSSVTISGGDGAYTTIDKDGDYMISSYVYGNHYYFSLPYPGTNYTIDDNNNEGNFINPAGLDHNLNIMFSNGTNGIKQINRYILGSNSASKNQLSNTLLNASPTAFKVSPYTTSSSTLFVGTENGKLLKLTNANNSNTSLIVWEEITGSFFVGSVSAIEFGETENDIFVTFHNYGITSIWYSSNGGYSWFNKEGNLPDMPVKCILQNPLAKNEVIVGTELGIWTTKNFNEDTPTWVASNNGMRDVKVVDLDLRTSDNTILATTFGRGVFTGKFSSSTNSTFTISTQNSVLAVCKSLNTAVYNFNFDAIEGYNTLTNISVSGIPGGATSNLSSSSFNFSGTFDLTIGNLNAVTPGEYVITVTGIGGVTVSKDILLEVKENVSIISTISPLNESIGINGSGSILSWNADPQATFYEVDIATDAGFNNIIETEITGNTTYNISSILNLATVYYWRVRVTNECNTSDFSSTKIFMTTPLNDCNSYTNNTSVSILDHTVVSSTINIADSFTMSKVIATVNITHTYIHDLDLTLKSPNGTEILIFDNNCGDENDLNITFDDDASDYIVCGTEPVIGIVKPANPLSGFNGGNPSGVWKLEVYDVYNGDFGTLDNWSLEICKTQTITNSLFTNSPLIVGVNSIYILKQTETEATSSGSTAIEQQFMLTELPTKGEVRLNNIALGLGGTFTQDDINNNKITYVNSSSVNDTDFFKANITNATSGLLPNQQIDITVDLALGVDDDFFRTTGISVFPTVSNGNFYISSKMFLGVTTIDLFSISGQKVYSNQLNFRRGAVEQIKISNLSSGIYILKLNSTKIQGSKKIIIN